jgi:hypothetical protein
MAIQINGTSGISGVDGSAGTPALQGSDPNTGISFGTDTVNINTGGSTRATVDSAGRLLVGTPTSVSQNIANGTITPQLQNAGTNQSGSTISSVNYNSGGSPAILALGSSTGGTLATQGVVNNNGKLGRIAFTGSDGTTLLTAAEIIAEVDGTPGANDMPGRLTFSTTADGASTPTERMRLTSTGDLRFNSGYGSVATAYGCRAWVNFNGTGAVAIRASGNVSSITDNGTADYTANFSTAMPDGNFAVAGICKFTNATNAHFISLGDVNGGNSPSTTTCRFRTMFGTAAQDCDIVTIAIFR